MATLYIRHQELFEAVQFIQLNKEEGRPEFNYAVAWINYALANKILTIDGSDLVWGYKELNRRVMPSSWIIRSKVTGSLEIKTDLDFRNQFELQEATAI